MNDSVFNLESSEETTAEEDAPPEFGLVDIVEAFTAMRHESRAQTKETRTVAESMQAAVTNIQHMEAKLVALTASGSTDESRKLAELIADIDNQLTRAVAAASQSETNRRQHEESELKAIEDYFQGMHAIARRLARPLLAFVMEQHRANLRTTESSAVEGLNLILARLRRVMNEHHIQRCDALGQAFDAETMNAIGTVESHEYPAGHVAEQLSPSYRWRESLLRFAEVRVVS